MEIKNGGCYSFKNEFFENLISAVLEVTEVKISVSTLEVVEVKISYTVKSRTLVCLS